MMAVLSVLAAGPLVSVQDGGRAGLMRYGVPLSGPMDRGAFAAANLALDNPVDAPGIEISLGGLTLECLAGEVGFALAGGGFIAEHGGRRIGSWSIATLRAGERLVIRRGPWGSWCYLAFGGRMQAPEWLGSAATHWVSGLGGGRIMAGRRLEIADPSPRAPRAIPCPVQARARPLLHVILGPQQRFFAPETLAYLTEGAWRVTGAGDRMGVRLDGPRIVPAATLDMPSAPVSRGSIQVAGDGVATLLMADHQTTGGYPKIATVLDADLDGFAQLRPGDALAFRAVSPEQAVGLARTAALIARRWRGSLRATD